MQVERVPVAELVLDPRNARKGNVREIVASLQEFGQHRPLVVRRENNVVVIGNHTLKAMRTLGWRECDVMYVDDDEEKAIRRGLADNATGDKAGWDDEILRDLLEQVGAVPGISEAEVEKILADTGGEDAEEDPTYPLVAQPGEQYDYVVIVAMTETDVAYLRTKFQLREEKSFRSSNVGLSHVVTVDRFQELIR